jgi:hypothetical protein
MTKADDDRLAVLAPEIHGLGVRISKSAEQMAADVLACGHKLVEAKKLVKYGQWESWVPQHCGMSIRTAQRYMQIALSGLKSASVALLGVNAASASLAKHGASESTVTAIRPPAPSPRRPAPARRELAKKEQQAVEHNPSDDAPDDDAPDDASNDADVRQAADDTAAAATPPAPATAAAHSPVNIYGKAGAESPEVITNASMELGTLKSVRREQAQLQIRLGRFDDRAVASMDKTLEILDEHITRLANVLSPADEVNG